MESSIINRLSALDSIKQLAPQIQQWILEEYSDYDSFVDSLDDRYAYALLELISERKLNLQEQKILFLRYGIIDGTPKTLEEVSRIMGITRDRARLIEYNCLHRGCHLRRSKKLSDYLDD